MASAWRSTAVTGWRGNRGVPVSIQQARWLSLIAKGYGLRVIPIEFMRRFSGSIAMRPCLALDEEPLLRTFFPQGRPQIRSTHEVLDSFDALSWICEMWPIQPSRLASRCAQWLARYPSRR